MASADTPERSAYVVENKDLEELFDAIDERTRRQQNLHDHIADGFMSLARERYREPSSAERLGRLVYDDRDDVRSNVHVSVEVTDDRDIVLMARLYEENEDSSVESDTTLRRRNGKAEVSESTTVERRVTRHADVRNSFMAVPSREVREAIRCFRAAVDQAIELVNTNSKLQATLHARSKT